MKTLLKINCVALLLAVLGLAGCENMYNTSVPIQPPNITRLDSSTYQVTVDARAPWVATSVIVKKGEKLHISAEGTWGESPAVNRTADGGAAGIFGSGYWGVMRRVPYAPWGALVGRVGISRFLIGSTATLTMPEDGELLLGINDGDESLDDNHGSLTVKVQLNP